MSNTMNADGTPIAERVQQEDSCGCTVAAVAMCTGKTYAEVRSAASRDFATDGLQIEDWYDYLFENGFSFYRVWRVTQLKSPNHAREVWPPEPFAPIHICSVSSSAGGHAVVMRQDGTVLDPAKDGVFHLSDYESVYMVLGLFPRAEERERVLWEALREVRKVHSMCCMVGPSSQLTWTAENGAIGSRDLPGLDSRCAACKITDAALATPAPAQPAQPSVQNGGSK